MRTGLVGKSRKPKRMFCIYLKKAKFHSLSIGSLRNFNVVPKNIPKIINVKITSIVRELTIYFKIMKHILFIYTVWRFITGLVGKLKRVVEVLKEDESEQKGNDFEKYVVNLFDDKYFSIVQWSTDIMRKHDRFVESDTGPDLIVRYLPKDEVFCVECKFRSGLFEGKLQWSDSQQLKRYQDFAREKKLPFFVVIGFGGNSSYPERMFCIPLEEAKYPALFPGVFKKFERNPNKPFFWKSGLLK